ncbi:metallophosphoesterase family protein [Vagococcus carniphilus]|uniref:Serine/threonine protein phosphatase n=1 Tax=Vagococcus carniphilus TaxID=218144 RepID=A0A430B993_9ENTE|nr:metallophosphoesterase family protein [Vagococcus carniphilus]QNN73655.1 serine/threonine protein phosphatase [Vagococcus carniphilus]RSU16822.1 serine/threonine protein phosphatase [Vagococcus carniphilus]
MEKYLFVISDIHGDLSLFKSLLNDYDKQSHQLVLIGDLLDRGLNSKECLLLGMELIEEGAVYLRGNHEQLFLDFLKDPENRYSNYLLNGGGETIESMLHKGAIDEYSPTEISLMIQTRYKQLIKCLESLPYYFEWNHYLCVHAGINLLLSSWKETTLRDFLWIRGKFHELPNKTSKTIVFGHTPTMYLYKKSEETRLWFSDEKIGIDGGGVYGGSVHGVIFDKAGIVQDIEYKSEYIWEPRF